MLLIEETVVKFQSTVEESWNLLSRIQYNEALSFMISLSNPGGQEL